MEVAVGGGTLRNPVCVASGTFGYGSEYEDLIDLEQIGALFAKSVTVHPRPGNAVPRLVETPSGLLNSIGLANVGLERFVSESASSNSEPADLKKISNNGKKVAVAGAGPAGLATAFFLSRLGYQCDVFEAQP